MLGIFILIYLLSIFYLPRFAFILTVFMLYGFIKNKNYILSQTLLCIWIISPFIYEFALTSKMNFLLM
ncbi:putative membrane protein (plasmid) [Clostridium botulinum]|uniref:Putative membrane protein n=1 Tax=Clostridium botulinum TaxID=1491 RepID=A0A1L7JN22_CLOBO|nr:putative membrane protein [Clostridium botulinum]